LTVTVKLPAAPAVNVVLLALVNEGADWVAKVISTGAPVGLGPVFV
jgi:hypothetical protein